MKTCHGWRSGYAVDVTVNGRPLKPRFDLWNHSPTGFEWGYGGSGPAQLALALLADHLGNDQEAVAYHQHFKFAVIARVLRPDSFCVSFYGWPEADRFLSVWKRCGLRPVSHFVWIKDYASRKGYTESRHEMAYLLAKGSPRVPEHPPSDVLPWNYTGNLRHPTEKPVSALLPLIEAYSQRGGIVLDPFAGSGSTGVAARIASRRTILIEKEWHHHRQTAERLRKIGLSPSSLHSSAPHAGD